MCPAPMSGNESDWSVYPVPRGGLCPVRSQRVQSQPSIPMPNFGCKRNPCPMVVQVERPRDQKICQFRVQSRPCTPSDITRREEAKSRVHRDLFSPLIAANLLEIAWCCIRQPPKASIQSKDHMIAYIPPPVQPHDQNHRTDSSHFHSTAKVVCLHTRMR